MLNVLLENKWHDERMGSIWMLGWIPMIEVTTVYVAKYLRASA
jgi:hypothetical protein